MSAPGNTRTHGKGRLMHLETPMRFSILLSLIFASVILVITDNLIADVNKNAFSSGYNCYSNKLSVG